MAQFFPSTLLVQPTRICRPIECSTLCYQTPSCRLSLTSASLSLAFHSFMATVIASPSIFSRPCKRRRTATSVLAGDFDPRPPRDVLTSLLNGVSPYKPIEGDVEERKKRKEERRAREREQKRIKKQQERAERGPDVARRQSLGVSAIASASGQSTPSRATPVVNNSTSSFWRTRGPVVQAERSVSPSPPPDFYNPPTPGPSIASTTSRTSSKRPHTPDDGVSLFDHSMGSPPLFEEQKPRRKRVATRKGWKGWVEGSPPPSDKLINLDSAPVMRERRLRSGKNFDAISEGQDTWVNPGKIVVCLLLQFADPAVTLS